MKYIIAIGVFQALFSIVLLYSNKLRKKADTLLMLLLFCIAAHLGIKFFIYNFIEDAEVRLQMNTFIGLAYGPLLYLYAKKQADPEFIPASRWYVFLPFIAGAVAYLTVVCLLSTSASTGYRVLHLYNDVSVYFFISVLLTFSLLSLSVARRELKPLPSEQRLITRISMLFLLLICVSLTMSILNFLKVAYINPVGRSIVYAVLSFVCLIIIRLKYAGSGAIPESSAVLDTEGKHNLTAPVSEPIFVHEPAGDKKLLLSREEHAMILEKLEQYLTRTKAYTDSELSLDKLAKDIGVNKHQLSETLNSYAQKSFYQYINEHRIRHIITKMQLMNKQELPVNVLSLAYDGGFKAKSSFNQYFKKITGLTPTEYIKSFTNCGNLGIDQLHTGIT